RPAVADHTFQARSRRGAWPGGPLGRGLHGSCSTGRRDSQATSLLERPPVRREPPQVDEKILLRILKEEGIKASWLDRISPKYDAQRFRRTARLFYERVPESRINGP